MWNKKTDCQKVNCPKGKRGQPGLRRFAPRNDHRCLDVIASPKGVAIRFRCRFDFRSRMIPTASRAAKSSKPITVPLQSGPVTKMEVGPSAPPMTPMLPTCCFTMIDMATSGTSCTNAVTDAATIMQMAAIFIRVLLRAFRSAIMALRFSSFSESCCSSDLSVSGTMVSPSSSPTETSKTSAMRISISESGTDRPFSHLDTVCRTTLSRSASSSWDMHFWVRRIFRFSCNMVTLLGFAGRIIASKPPLRQATGVNIVLYQQNTGHCEVRKECSDAADRGNLREPISETIRRFSQIYFPEIATSALWASSQ